MSEGKIKDCPSCRCEHATLHLLTLDCFWECAHCYMQGPHKETESEADAGWNAIPRWWEILDQLNFIADAVQTEVDEPHCYYLRHKIFEVVAKYEPIDGKIKT